MLFPRNEIGLRAVAQPSVHAMLGATSLATSIGERREVQLPPKLDRCSGNLDRLPLLSTTRAVRLTLIRSFGSARPGYERGCDAVRRQARTWSRMPGCDMADAFVPLSS